MVEVTARTIGGRFLLRPEPRLNDRIVGAMRMDGKWVDRTAMYHAKQQSADVLEAT
jgi:hypothetical protein